MRAGQAVDRLLAKSQQNLLLIDFKRHLEYFFDSHHRGTRKYRQTYYFLHDELWSSRSCDHSSQEFSFATLRPFMVFEKNYNGKASRIFPGCLELLSLHYVPSWCSRRTTTRPHGFQGTSPRPRSFKFKLHVDKVYYGKQCRPFNIYCNLQNTFPVAKFVMPSSLKVW